MHRKASLDGAGCCKGNDEWALAARVALVHSVRHRQVFRLATLGYDARSEKQYHCMQAGTLPGQCCSYDIIDNIGV